MAQIDWTADLETGFADIDSQHKQMVFYINELHKVRNSGDAMLIAQTLFDLISCTMNHFAYEEELLEAAGYGLTEPHRNTHTNFTNRLLDFQNRIMSGESVTEELLDQLDNWIFRHIRINDQGYVEMIKESGLYEQDNGGKWQRISSEPEWHELPASEPIVETPEPQPEPEKNEPQPVFTAVETEEPQQPEPSQEEPKHKPPRSWAGTY